MATAEYRNDMQTDDQVDEVTDALAGLNPPTHIPQPQQQQQQGVNNQNINSPPPQQQQVNSNNPAGDAPAGGAPAYQVQKDKGLTVRHYPDGTQYAEVSQDGVVYLAAFQPTMFDYRNVYTQDWKEIGIINGTIEPSSNDKISFHNTKVKANAAKSTAVLKAKESQNKLLTSIKDKNENNNELVGTEIQTAEVKVAEAEDEHGQAKNVYNLNLVRALRRL